MAQLQNNKEEVPFEHYVKAFSGLDPLQAAARCGVAFDQQTGLFTLHLLGKRCQIHWPEYAISG